MKTITKSGAPVPVNNALLNIITPMGGLEFSRNKIYLGENLAKVYAVSKYPENIEVGWLSRIANLPQTVSVQIFEPCDNGTLIEHLSRSVNQNRGVAESTRDVLQRQRAERTADDAEKLIKQIDQYGETVGYMTIIIMPVADSDAELEKICRSSEGSVAVMRCKSRLLANAQKEAFQATSPCHVPPDDVLGIARRNVPLSTFMGGMPFASPGFSDRDGLYFGKDAQGGLILLDPWLRENDRTNSNFTILGVPGVGKSTAVKSIILTEFMSGTKIIVIDPEREYREMCLKLGGDWINCGGGSGGRINQLEIRSEPTDADAGEGESSMGSMALHFKSFEVFIKLYADLSERQKAIVKQLLEELYAESGITWDTDVSGLKHPEFPVFADLYALAVRKLSGNGGGSDLEYLAVILRELAEGSDSFLFNGATTISAKSRFICLDTHDLQNADGNVKKAQYFNLLTWAWSEMSRDRSEKVLLICDEAYLLVDPNVPQSLVFLRDVAKRARKYEAGLVIASHSIVDFLDPAVKMYGQALMDLPAYKILMGCDGQNLAETTALYNLTEMEQEFLLSKKRKHALFFAGARRMLVHFDLPDHRLAAMGSGGGR